MQRRVIGLVWKAPPPEEAPGGELGFGRAVVAAIGALGALSLVYFTFLAPNVVARWIFVALRVSRPPPKRYARLIALRRGYARKRL